MRDFGGDVRLLRLGDAAPSVAAIAGFPDRYGFGDDEFFGPTWLAVDPEGGLIVSDVVTGRVRKIESAH